MNGTSGWGGKRPGAGGKPKYGERTKVMRVPISRVGAVRRYLEDGTFEPIEQMLAAARAKMESDLAARRAELDAEYIELGDKQDKMEASFEKRVASEVKRRLKPAVEAAEYEAIHKERKRAAKELEEGRFTPIGMPKKEQDLILNCLHPDRADRDPARLAKAFNIFKRAIDFYTR